MIWVMFAAIVASLWMVWALQDKRQEEGEKKVIASVVYLQEKIRELHNEVNRNHVAITTKKPRRRVAKPPADATL